jgi:hypothetical protein
MENTPDNTNGIDEATSNLFGDNNNASQDDGLTSDPILSKHLDIALDAQDGKTSAESGDTQNTSSGEQAAAGGNSNSNATNNNAQQPPVKEGTENKGNTRGPQDLVVRDAAGNEQVIRGGPERRFYEQAQVAKQRATHLEGELNNTRQQLNEVQGRFETLNTSLQSLHGMPANDVAGAVRLFSDLKRDPSGTLKILLAEAVAAGHTVDGSGVDAKALELMLDRRLGSTSQQDTQQSEQQIVAEAQREASNFFSSFPDAKPHDALIARVMRENPGMDLHTVYFQLKENFAVRGFDWSQPLEPQLEARAAASQQNNQQQNNQQPLPNGRPQLPNIQQTDGGSVAHESTDTGDIVRQAMREAGLNV